MIFSRVRSYLTYPCTTKWNGGGGGRIFARKNVFGEAFYHEGEQGIKKKDKSKKVDQCKEMSLG